MCIAENIKKIRKEKGMTQKQLAQKAGLAVITIQQYEAGKYKPKIGALAKIAEALNVYIGRLDESWGVDISNNPEEYEKFRNKLAAFETALEKDMELYTNGESERNSWNRELDLLSHFRKLNKAGEEKAIEQVEMLTKIPEYRYMTLEEANAELGIDVSKHINTIEAKQVTLEEANIHFGTDVKKYIEICKKPSETQGKKQ